MRKRETKTRLIKNKKVLIKRSTTRQFGQMKLLKGTFHCYYSMKFET